MKTSCKKIEGDSVISGEFKDFQIVEIFLKSVQKILIR